MLQLRVPICLTSTLDMQIDLKHKPTVHTKQCCLSPTDFTPASSQPFCMLMLGKRGKLCFAKLFCFFCFLFLSTNCIWCCYSWFMENASEENCCNDRKPLGNGSCNSFPWEFTGIFKGCWVLGS